MSKTPPAEHQDYRRPLRAQVTTAPTTVRASLAMATSSRAAAAAQPSSATHEAEIVAVGGSVARVEPLGARPSGSRSTRAPRGSVHYEVR